MGYTVAASILFGVALFFAGFATHDIISVWRHGADSEELVDRAQSREAAAKEKAWLWRQKAESLAAQLITAVDAGPQTNAEQSADTPYDRAVSETAEARVHDGRRAAVYEFVVRERDRDFDPGEDPDGE